MKRIVVGITGASGAIYGIRLLELLRDKAEVHLVVSEAGWRVIAHETGREAPAVKALADAYYEIDDIGAAISGGSFRTDGMVIAPCSIKSLSAVANSYTDTLLIRAADVTLKQRRPLVLCVRETPLHPGHLALMSRAARNGAVILPPVPAFYNRPTTITEIIDHTVFTVLDILGIDDPRFRRWPNTATNGGVVE